MFKKGVVVRIATFLGAMTLALGVAAAGFASGGSSLTPDQALQKLMAGNKRYVKGRMTGAKLSDAKTRLSLATSQKPYAIILSCSDSRLPPEIIFDKGLGEIFVIRVAGNIPDPVVLGSIEYAAEHLGSPLIMVLGHERCGAVTATVQAGGKSTGSPNLDALTGSIQPAVDAAMKECEACKTDKNCAKTRKSAVVECAADINARRIAANLPAQSKIIRELVEEKKVRIVAAKYDLDDGIVTLFK